jgi:diaminohydroxyphosphoribosylaminopyrimidine deaminase/5-amino-6-(5-phosphoribosylamino)uracil reductase
MASAISAGEAVRGSTSPNPWVGCVIVPHDGDREIVGETQPSGRPHAEATALERAGQAARGATAYVSLEPCAHHGRTPPCADALVDAGVARVVVAIEDPDPRVAGRGIARLRAAGLEVTLGVGAERARRSLAPYLAHRRTGRPWVVLKLASTLDGRTAAPDGTSKWITGPEARADVQRLRAESDAIVVGAGTVRADDPELRVRDEPGRPLHRDPLRIVLGGIPPTARVHPAQEHRGDLALLLDDLGARGVLQVLVEGGAHVAHAFHAASLVDQYVVYVAPAILGGDDGLGLLAGAGAPSMSGIWRGRLDSVRRVGDDVRLDVLREPSDWARGSAEGGPG